MSQHQTPSGKGRTARSSGAIALPAGARLFPDGEPGHLFLKTLGLNWRPREQTASGSTPRPATLPRPGVQPHHTGDCANTNGPGYLASAFPHRSRFIKEKRSHPWRGGEGNLKASLGPLHKALCLFLGEGAGLIFFPSPTGRGSSLGDSWPLPNVCF